MQRPDKNKNPGPYRMQLRKKSVRELILPTWLFPVKEGEMHDLKHCCVIRTIRTAQPDRACAVRIMQRLLKNPSNVDCRTLPSNLRNPGAHGRPHCRTALMLHCRNDIRSKPLFLTIHIINLGNAFLYGCDTRCR